MNHKTKEADRPMLFTSWRILSCIGLFAYAGVVSGGDAAFASVLLIFGILAAKYAANSKRVVSLLRLVGAALIFFGFIFLLSASYKGYGDSSDWHGLRLGNRTECSNRMKQLATAVLVYKEKHGKLPEVTPDEEGRPMHSWLTQIMPYIELGTLYEKVDLDRPWDDPVNKVLRLQCDHLFRCPSSQSAINEPGMTNYVAVIGPGTVWSEPEGDLSKKIMFVETADPIPWAKPHVLSADDLPFGHTDLRYLASSNHFRPGFFVLRCYKSGFIAYGNGRVEFFEHGAEVIIDWPQIFVAASYLFFLMPIILLPLSSQTEKKTSA